MKQILYNLCLYFLSILLMPTSSSAQYVLLNLKANECTNCSKNFPLISEINGDKFLVFGTRYHSREQVLNKRFQEYITYNSIIYNDSLEIATNKISDNFTKNVIVYDKHNKVALKCHYKDLDHGLITRINQILADKYFFESSKSLTKDGLKVQLNDIKELQIIKDNEVRTVDLSQFDYNMFIHKLNESDRSLLQKAILSGNDPNKDEKNLQFSSFSMNSQKNILLVSGYMIFSDNTDTAYFYNKVCVRKFNETGILTAIYPVNTTNQNMVYVSSVVGDSLLFMIEPSGVRIINNKSDYAQVDSYFISKYQLKDEVYEFVEKVHFPLNIINRNLYNGNYMVLNQSDYPYFGNSFSPIVFNDITKKTTHIISPTVYDSIYNTCKTDALSPSSCTNIYSIVSIKYNQVNKETYVIYKYNSRRHFLTIDADGSVDKRIDLEHLLQMKNDDYVMVENGTYDIIKYNRTTNRITRYPLFILK